jgi:hypothetical protein
MNITIQFIELTLNVDQNTLNEIMEDRSSSYLATLHSDSRIYLDDCLIDDGLGFELHDKRKKKVRLLVNPSMLIGHKSTTELWQPDEKSTSKLISKLERRVDDYFDSNFELKDFKLSKICFTADVHLPDSKTAESYIRVLHKIGMVKNFLRVQYGKKGCGASKDHAFVLMGKSNGIVFAAYTSKSRSSHFGGEPIWKPLILDQNRNSLRFDVLLKTQKAIRAFTYYDYAQDRITDLADTIDKPFKTVFQSIIPYGEFHKLPAAIKIVEKEIENKSLKAKMIKLMTLIKEKKSLLMAQREMFDRNIESIMNEFRKIDLSPVTISKRQEESQLGCLYKLMSND